MKDEREKKAQPMLIWIGSIVLFSLFCPSCSLGFSPPHCTLVSSLCESRPNEIKRIIAWTHLILFGLPNSHSGVTDDNNSHIKLDVTLLHNNIVQCWAFVMLSKTKLNLNQMQCRFAVGFSRTSATYTHYFQAIS